MTLMFPNRVAERIVAALGAQDQGRPSVLARELADRPAEEIVERLLASSPPPSASADAPIQPPAARPRSAVRLHPSLRIEGVLGGTAPRDGRVLETG
jgi:16S rRNA A1518/A1519 N6-dimethyltransferase RsmA/KsgA/DIM1 with predicted DNA glycosylase/AP lyase activity